MILSLNNTVNDAFAVFVVFVDIKVDHITHINEFLVSLEISAGLAHDDFITVIDKVESAYSLDDGACHMSLFCIFLFFFFLFVLIGIAAVFRFSFRFRLRTGAYLQVYRRALVEL